MSIFRVRAFSVPTVLLTAAVGACFAALSAHPHFAEAQPLPAQSRPQAPPPELTPFEKNPFLFRSPQEAVRALDSPDALMRRSGVEWLGQWTYTYTSYGGAPNAAACAQLQSLARIIPGLIRAVREMPLPESQQAARLLAAIGPPAHSAIPAVCNALIDQGSQDVFQRYEMMNSLIHLCGGPDRVASKLAPLMLDSEPETRRAAAGAAGLCDDIGFNLSCVSRFCLREV